MADRLGLIGPGAPARPPALGATAAGEHSPRARTCLPACPCPLRTLFLSSTASPCPLSAACEQPEYNIFHRRRVEVRRGQASQPASTQGRYQPACCQPHQLGCLRATCAVPGRTSTRRCMRPAARASPPGAPWPRASSQVIRQGGAWHAHCGPCLGGWWVSSARCPAPQVHPGQPLVPAAAQASTAAATCPKARGSSWSATRQVAALISCCCSPSTPLALHLHCALVSPARQRPDALAIGAPPRRLEPLAVCLQHLSQKKLVEKKHQLDIVNRLRPIADELGCTLGQVGGWTGAAPAHVGHTLGLLQRWASARDGHLQQRGADGRADRPERLRVPTQLPPPQLALAWCAHNPNVSTVITGATKVEQARHRVLLPCGPTVARRPTCCRHAAPASACHSAFPAMQVEENMAALRVMPKLTPDVLVEIGAVVGEQYD